MYKKTYKAWIKKFLNDDNPIGDLARDIKIDKTFPLSRRKATIEDYLFSKHACSGAMDAFYDSFDLYRFYLRYETPFKS